MRFNTTSSLASLAKNILAHYSAVKECAFEILAPDFSNSSRQSQMRGLAKGVETVRGEDYFANSRNRGFANFAITVARAAISRAAASINSSDNSPSPP